MSRQTARIMVGGRGVATGANEPAETVYTVSGRCRDCGAELPPDAPKQRRYCDRDRQRRRALTFIRKGEAILAQIGAPA